MLVGEKKLGRCGSVGVGVLADDVLQRGGGGSFAESYTGALLAAFFHTADHDVNGTGHDRDGEQDGECFLIVLEKLLELAGAEIDFSERGD